MYRHESFEVAEMIHDAAILCNMATRDSGKNVRGMNSKGKTVPFPPLKPAGKPTEAIVKPGQKAKDLGKSSKDNRFASNAKTPVKESIISRGASNIGKAIVGVSGAGAMANAIMKPSKKSVAGGVVAAATSFGAGAVGKVVAKGSRVVSGGAATGAKTVMKSIKPSTGKAIIEGSGGRATVASGVKRVAAQTTVSAAKVRAGQKLVDKQIAGRVAKNTAGAAAAYRLSTTTQKKDNKKK